MSFVNFVKIAIEKQVNFLWRRSNEDVSTFLSQVKTYLVDENIKKQIDNLKSRFMGGEIDKKVLLQAVRDLLEKDMESVEKQQQEAQEFFTGVKSDEPEVEEPASEKQKPSVIYAPNKSYLLPLSKFFTEADTTPIKKVLGEESFEKEIKEIPTDPDKIDEFVKKKKDFTTKVEQISQTLKELKQLQGK